jgi:hypothetical protein
VSGGISQLFLNLGTRRGCVVIITPRPPLPPGKDRVPILQEAGWAPEQVWIGAENLAQPGFDPRTFRHVASRYIDCAIPVLHPRPGFNSRTIYGVCDEETAGILFFFSTYGGSPVTSYSINVS